MILAIIVAAIILSILIGFGLYYLMKWGMDNFKT